MEFYHTMTSRREPNLTAIHFATNGQPGILRATNIAATFNLSVVLANSFDYRQWPHPSTKEMVRLLSRDTTTGSILFRRQLPPRMLLIDHILRSNLFPLQHLVYRKRAILEALYRISEGFWFNPIELNMTSLFHFEDKVHRKNLTRAESTPLLFPRLLCQVLKHIGFLAEPRLERRQDYGAILTVNRWQIMPRSYHLPPPDLAEDQPIVDLPIEEQPPPAMHTEEPQIPTSSNLAPATTTPLPTAPASSVPPEPSTPSTIAHTDLAGPSSSAPPPRHITISTWDFLAIIDVVHTFSVTSASFATAHAALTKRMTGTKAALTQNQVILRQIQSHLSLLSISPSVPA